MGNNHRGMNLIKSVRYQESGISYNRHEKIKYAEAIQKAAARTADLQYLNGWLLFRLLILVSMSLDHSR